MNTYEKAESEHIAQRLRNILDSGVQLKEERITHTYKHRVFFEEFNLHEDGFYTGRTYIGPLSGLFGACHSKKVDPEDLEKVVARFGVRPYDVDNLEYSLGIKQRPKFAAEQMRKLLDNIFGIIDNSS